MSFPNRAPEGDWCGTQFLRLERHGSIAVLTVDRPHRRNAMTPAMYFGVRYAVDRVTQSDDLAGLVITGTGDSTQDPAMPQLSTYPKPGSSCSQLSSIGQASDR